MRLASIPPRRGFTLIEVLVAAGLSMLIMAVVTAAFQKGMDTLSQLKSVGELQQRLRNFELAMRADLEADHFDSRYGPRVSDQRLDLLNVPATSLSNDSVTWRPPTKGFFNIDQGIGLSTMEGLDNDGNISTRAMANILHMTVRRGATSGAKVFSTTLSPNVTPTTMAGLAPMSMTQMSSESNAIVSDWAEVVYFLDTANPLSQTPGATPLYGLYRRVRVLPSTGNPGNTSWTSLKTPLNPSGQVMTPADLTQNLGVSYSPVVSGSQQHQVNDPQSIRNPNNRLGGINHSRSGMAWYDNLTSERNGITNQPTGADLLLMDVISFEIKANWDGGTVPPGSAAAGLNNTYEFPFSDLPAATTTGLTTGTPRNSALMIPTIGTPRVFDTWFDTSDDSWLKGVTGVTGTRNVIPQPMRIRALQIKARVWDRKNNMARQVTIIENM